MNQDNADIASYDGTKVNDSIKRNAEVEELPHYISNFTGRVTVEPTNLLIGGSIAIHLDDSDVRLPCVPFNSILTFF